MQDALQSAWHHIHAIVVGGHNNVQNHIITLFLRFGTRFPCMSDAYSRQLCQVAQEVGAELGYSDFLREGVYCVLGGPSFETIAECRMLNLLGADAVGESVIYYRRQHLVV